MAKIRPLFDQPLVLSVSIVGAILSVFSCVSRTTPEGRVAQSLSMASPANFSIAGGSSAPFSFAMVGDIHIGSGETERFSRILTAAQAEGDQFVILLGDIIDEGEESDYIAYNQAIASAGYTGKVFAVAGNHDVFYAGWDNFMNRIGSSTYAFTAGNSTFIALDSADGTLGTRQMAWLRGQLSGPRLEHTFVLSHYMPLVPGVSTYLKFASETEASSLMSIASANGVRGWFGAHYHSYVKETIAGVTYVVAGGGGGRRMPPYRNFFFVQVQVNGSSVEYAVRPVD
jgi:hypothetical protein